MHLHPRHAINITPADKVGQEQRVCLSVNFAGLLALTILLVGWLLCLFVRPVLPCGT